jgi:probable FeS assembly SUF system protein SufT
MRESKTLTRDIEATAIPYGDRISLSAGATIYVTQALGGSYTGMTDRGYMVRIEGKDADAIGEEVTAAPAPDADAGKSLSELCWDQLKMCYDPEIPVNIVDLGLVYSCDVEVAPDGGQQVSVHFTLTSPGCGMGEFLRHDIEQKMLGIEGIEATDIRIVFEPTWDQSMMSEAARLQLGFM